MSIKACRDAAPRRPTPERPSQQAQESGHHARPEPSHPTLLKGALPAAAGALLFYGRETMSERSSTAPVRGRRRRSAMSAKGCWRAACPSAANGPTRRISPPALWLVLERPDIVPERDLPGLIRRYNESVGGVNDETQGYHETITQCFIRAVRVYLRRVPADLPLVEQGQRPARSRPKAGATGRCASTARSVCSRFRRGSAWSSPISRLYPIWREFGITTGST